jgi:putative serine protease PepD
MGGRPEARAPDPPSEPAVTSLAVVDGEDQGTPECDPDDDWPFDADRDGDGLRGWISPDDRLWRHPSEVAVAVGGGRQAGPPLPGPHRSRPVPWVIGGATVCFVLVLVAAGMVISVTGDADRAPTTSLQSLIAPEASPTTEPGTGALPSAAAVRSLVDQVSPSTVSIVSTGSWGTSTSAGLVVDPSGIIATTASSVDGARSLVVLEASGTRQQGTVIGVDRATGLTLISVPDDLPVPAYDTTDPVPGSVAMAMSLAPARSAGQAPTMSVYAGLVTSTGRTVSADQQTATFTATSIRATLPRVDIGCPLVDAQGHVTGLLDAVTGSGGSALSVFLPAQLVFDVAAQLIRFNQVVHGSLGAEATDDQPAGVTATSTVGAGASAGARLVAVDRDGPAAQSGMMVGDVITGVDGAPVRSSAELETRLYADGPGTSVMITCSRGGTTEVRSVTLGAAESDASAVSLSP